MGRSRAGRGARRLAGRAPRRCSLRPTYRRAWAASRPPSSPSSPRSTCRSSTGQPRRHVWVFGSHPRRCSRGRRLWGWGLRAPPRSLTSLLYHARRPRYSGDTPSVRFGGGDARPPSGGLCDFRTDLPLEMIPKGEAIWSVSAMVRWVDSRTSERIWLKRSGPLGHRIRTGPARPDPRPDTAGRPLVERQKEGPREIRGPNVQVLRLHSAHAY